MDLASAIVVFSSLHVVACRPLEVVSLLQAEESTKQSSTAERTRYDIISSCIFTIIACVWTSAHPNVAAPQDGGLTIFKRRVITMIYALIAPEAVLMWALRQNIAAERIASSYNRKLENQIDPAKAQDAKDRSLWLWTYLGDFWKDIKRSTTEWLFGFSKDQVLRHDHHPWTKTHGLFIQMGGFVLYYRGRPIRVLSFKVFKRLRHQGLIDEPLVTERELQDRTKSDTLSKFLVVIQSTWFVLQCAARRCAGLPLTELEVVTLGFAVLNAGIYAFWWNKPQGVQVAIAVPLKVKDDSQTSESLAAAWTGSDKDLLQFILEDDFQLDGNCNDHLRVAQGMTPDLESDPTPQAKTILRRAISTILQPFKDMLSCRTIPPGALRVPDFYADDKGRKESGKACMIACIVGTIFGLLHALAWSSVFPSASELTLWKLSTFIIILEPIFMLVVGILYDDKEEGAAAVVSEPPSPDEQRPLVGLERPPFNVPPVKKYIQHLFIFLFFIITPLYIWARFTLIILAFTTLRALPPDAFKIVLWTSFIPHL